MSKEDYWLVFLCPSPALWEYPFEIPVARNEITRYRHPLLSWNNDSVQTPTRTLSQLLNTRMKIEHDQRRSLTLQCDGRYLLLATLLPLFSSRSSSVVEQVPRDNTIALKEGWKRLWRVIKWVHIWDWHFIDQKIHSKNL